MGRQHGDVIQRIQDGLNPGDFPCVEVFLTAEDHLPDRESRDMGRSGDLVEIETLGMGHDPALHGDSMRSC